MRSTSVCLSVCPLTSQKPQSKLHEIFYTYYLWSWLAHCLTTMQYIMYFRFCGCVMFAHNWTGKGDASGAYTQRDSPEGSTGAKFTIALLWPPYRIGQTIISLPCGFFCLLSFFLFSSPNLSRRRLDVCHTSSHGVALVRI